jgi:hypothetical protein
MQIQLKWSVFAEKSMAHFWSKFKTNKLRGHEEQIEPLFSAPEASSWVRAIETPLA